MLLASDRELRLDRHVYGLVIRYTEMRHVGSWPFYRGEFPWLVYGAGRGTTVIRKFRQSRDRGMEDGPRASLFFLVPQDANQCLSVGCNDQLVDLGKRG